MEQNTKKTFYRVRGRDSNERLHSPLHETTQKLNKASSKKASVKGKPSISSKSSAESRTSTRSGFSATKKKEKHVQKDVETAEKKDNNEEVSEREGQKDMKDDTATTNSDQQQVTEVETQHKEKKPNVKYEDLLKPKKDIARGKLISEADRPKPKTQEEKTTEDSKTDKEKLLSLAKKDYLSIENDNQDRNKISELKELKFDTKITRKGSVIQETKFAPQVGMSLSLTLDKKAKYDSFELDEESTMLTSEDSTDKKLRFEDDDLAEKKEISKGMRFEYGQCPKTCERFLNIEDYAKIFVDDIAETAMTKEKNAARQSSTKVVEGIEYTVHDSNESSTISSIGTYVCILEWPTIEEFTIQIGTYKVNEYVSYWKFEEKWKYCVNYLEGISDSVCDFYRYEATFSLPCKQYPIAQATASVYFTFEVSRIRPPHCLVDMYYWFEGQRSIHKPGNFTFQEERLFNIVDAKIKFYKTLTF
ncbi:uncharacterized protein LOC135134509 isoform X2 [Zophobas morio]|uniref:uncharacterized protein LOC135134509 isoform X2 n=1 Tax=Zophobas morio TaxID=2755281 RepID=UPI003082BB3C